MKKSLTVALAAVLATLGLLSSGAEAARSSVKPSHGRAMRTIDWTHVVTPTRAGGFTLGNPNAKVKLVEFGSLTCPHCRHFDEDGVPHLLDYVKSGQVSWEFRNYVRDAFDITASLIARCDGPKRFFPLTRALFKDQQSWEAKIAATPDDQLHAMQDLPPERQFIALAKVAGLQQWAAAHGIPAVRSSQCLADPKAIKQLVDMAGSATSEFPDFAGTPTFVINGKMLEKTATWDTLEPQLKAALGAHG